jgi:hypothetical protein
MMSLTGFACTFALAVPLSGAPESSSGSSSRDELRAQISELQREVDELRAASTDQWLTQRRADEIRDLVQDVLADADTRSSLLQSGAVAGWDKGFFLASADGSYRLNLKGYLQVRYIYNNQDESPSDDNRGGFENARTQLFWTGHVVDPSWKYWVQGDFSRSSGSFTLLDAWISKSFDNGWSITAGQFRMPLLREFLVVETTQLAVDRSLVHQEFTGARTQGVMVGYKGDRFRISGSFNDGLAASNMGSLTEDTEFALTGRAEFLAAGNWDQFNDFTSKKGEDTAVMIGGAAHYQRAEFGTGTGAGLPFSFNDDEIDTLVLTGDVSAEFGAANVFGAVVYRNFDSDGGVDLDQFGVVIQGGFYINDTWELFARYEWGDADDGSEDLSLITVGVNKYFSRHQIKWTTDIGFGLNEISSVWGGPAAEAVGWRTDSVDNDGQVSLRSQLQLAF